MYQYSHFDHAFVRARSAEFREQVGRRLAGELTEEEFKPLRLMNGLYLQLHAYMLRVAIPYGTLSSRQMRKLAEIARRWDRGYGHFTTRQNIQFNWPKLEDVPDILDALADVEMHAIQTSGNCIRNVTADQFAGAAADEIEDSRVWAEIIRQWSTLHPEFSFLPRKFKIAVTGAETDRAAVKFHDIGLRMRRNASGSVGFEVVVGGGQGRTPIVGETIRDFLPKEHLLSYLEAILRTYNLLGRRDNLYKARIKILLAQTGVAAFAREVEAEWERIRDGALTLTASEIERIERFFAPPSLAPAAPDPSFLAAKLEHRDFARWARTNLFPHKVPGHQVVTISLKPAGGIPGDATAEQMDAAADLADRFSLGDIRVAHEQNLVLPHVREADLFDLWTALKGEGLAESNIGLITDIIACPGLDFCNLANARAIPVAESLSRRFADSDLANEIGPLTLNISGCINACGHHHVGNIGILGVDKKGEEFYQITLGGSAGDDAAIGAIVGPAVAFDRVTDTIERIIDVYRKVRREGEPFVAAIRRTGLTPFKEALYADR
ncbi:MAG: nitrite/sulfite reductase [Alphaproteobacteria bacterium]|nr:nitrite/sulfite reductase [Alphaproteobacteria bacterium]